MRAGNGNKNGNKGGNICMGLGLTWNLEWAQAGAMNEIQFNSAFKTN